MSAPSGTRGPFRLSQVLAEAYEDLHDWRVDFPQKMGELERLKDISRCIHALAHGRAALGLSGGGHIGSSGRYTSVDADRRDSALLYPNPSLTGDEPARHSRTQRQPTNSSMNRSSSPISAEANILSRRFSAR